MTYELKKSAMTPLASGGPVISRQIDNTAELGQHFGSGLKAKGIASGQGSCTKQGCTHGIQDHAAALSHFGFRESAGQRQLHDDSVAGLPGNFKLTRQSLRRNLAAWWE